MTPGVFLALTATIAVAALTPGPAVTAIVARAITDGARPALAINAGVVTGDLLFFALAAAGMAAAARSLGEVFAVVQWLGAAYLVWQGILLWRFQPGPRAAIAGAAHETHFWRNYAAGLLLMFGHVQAMLFYAALLPGLRRPDATDRRGPGPARADPDRRDRRHQCGVRPAGVARPRVLCRRPCPAGAAPRRRQPDAAGRRAGGDAMIG